MGTINLDALLRPQSVALIGASNRDRAVGAVIARNLFTGGFQGPVLPVNPRSQAIRSTLAYARVEDLPFAPDLAVICTPPDTVPGLIADLGARGTRAAVVITAGFSELGEAGAALERRMLEAARPYGLRILGPNCVGLMVPGIGLNASFAHLHPKSGGLGFIAQSGAVITSVVDWAAARKIGFSHLISVGDKADVDFGDLLDYMTADTRTKAILLYVEAIRDARKFMSAARAASRIKPVVVIKSGRHAASAQAAASHTGALAGADSVYLAAFRRAGMLRVFTIEEMFNAVETLAHWPSVKGDRLAIVSNGGGIGVIATDALMDEGGALAALSDSTIGDLNTVLPPTWSKANPVDIIGDADAERYGKAMTAVLKDKAVDALLVLNCPTAVADGEEAARAVAAVARKSRVPVFTSWLGGESATRARAQLTAAQVPTYDTPGQAVRALMHVVRYQRNQALLMEVPPPSQEIAAEDRAGARALVQQVLASGRDWLSESEAKDVLRAYGIPAVPTEVARGVEEAVHLAETMGYPVAVKILSPDITHKSDVGGVALDLEDAKHVRDAVTAMFARVKRVSPQARIEGVTVQPMVRRPRAIELIAGVVDDPTFGPAILFGRGGTAVEVIDDKALALPPLNRALALDTIRRTRVFRRLEGYRDRAPADLEAVARVLINLAEIAADLPEVAELDINPLYADEDGVLALDARIRVARPRGQGTQRFAIMPYPRHLEGSITVRDGSTLHLRPIRPQDAASLNAMIARCDPHDIRMRFFTALKSLPSALAARLTQIDYDREMAFVALDPSTAHLECPDVVGVVRLMSQPNLRKAEYAVIVRSDMKGKGLGFILMQLIITYAKQMGIQTLIGEVLAENKAMLLMCEELGFVKRVDEEDNAVMRVSLDLTQSSGVLDTD